MESLFSRDFAPLWALVLAVALFFPVRQLIWALYLRRAHRLGEVDEAESRRLRTRAGVTGALLCFVFSLLYTYHMFQGQP